MSIRLENEGQRKPLGTWSCPGAAAGRHCIGPRIDGSVPDWPGETFDLLLEVEGHPEFSSRYTLAFARTIGLKPSTP